MKTVSMGSRSIIWGCTILSLLVWAHYASVWWVHLEGDSPLYPMMSMRVLEGKHFIMTAGQSHGGTLLVYLRALLYKLFGVSQFLGFYVNGMAMALGVMLWTRFACRISGNFGGAITGILCAVGNERLVRAACTDYFAITMVTSGLMLNFSEFLSRKFEISRRDSFFIGFLLGISWYLCRFSALYAVSAFFFFAWLSPSVRSRLFIPSKSEFRKSVIGRLLSITLCIGLFLTVMGFFTSDRFLGVNAEANLKFTVILGAVTIFWFRWRAIIPAIDKILLVAAGAVIGLTPELYYKWFVPHNPDRVTGLVRWNDIEAMLTEIPYRIGIMFSFYSPTKWGEIAAISVLGIFFLGYFSEKKERYIPILLQFLIALGAWFSVHTYMHMASQYFFIAMFPIYLGAGFAARRSRFRAIALILSCIILGCGLFDIKNNLASANIYEESKIAELLDQWKTKWGVTSGFGQLDSDYNVMFATNGKVILPYARGDERFPDWQDAVRKLNRILYLYHPNDRQPPWNHDGYIVLDKMELKHGFQIVVLEKTSAVRID